MKKSKKKKMLRFIFGIFFVSFLGIYLSQMMGYYEYQNHVKTSLTEEQIKKFENDVSSGKQVDINQYLVIENKSYENNLSKITSKISDGISNIVESGVNKTFKFLSKFMDE